MVTEENKQLLRRFLYEAWNLKNICIIDELLSPAYCRHIATDPYLLSRATQKEMTVSVIEAFPDLCLAIEDIVAEDDRVVYRGVLRGTHKHRFRDVEPTHKHILLMVIGMVRVENNLIVEQWGGVNELELLRLLSDD